MSERFRPINEEVFQRADELIKTFEKKGGAMGPNQDIWNENLGRVREKLESYVYNGNIFSNYLFVPAFNVPNEDEEAIFSPVNYKQLSPRIELITLKPKTPEVTLYTSIIFDVSKAKPALLITQDSYSIFMVKGKDIQSLLLHYVPKLEWQVAIIEDQPTTTFRRFGLSGPEIERVELSTKDALKRFEIK